MKEEAQLKKNISDLESSREMLAKVASQATEVARDTKASLKVKVRLSLRFVVYYCFLFVTFNLEF